MAGTAVSQPSRSPTHLVPLTACPFAEEPYTMSLAGQAISATEVLAAVSAGDSKGSPTGTLDRRSGGVGVGGGPRLITTGDLRVIAMPRLG